MSTNYTGMSYATIADSYNEINYIDSQAAAEVGKAVAEIVGAGALMVDLGGGAGRISVPVAEAGVRMIALDFEYEMLRVSRENARRRGVEARQVNADVVHLPFKTNAFDGCITTSVYHLVPAWRDSIKEAARILKPGGIFIIGRNVMEAGSCADKVRKQLRQIAGAFDPSIRPTDAAGPELFKYIDSIGGQLDKPITVTSWVESESPNQILERIRNRKHNETWALNEETHAKVVGDMPAWIEQNFSNPDEVFDSKSEFILYPVRGLASTSARVQL